MELPDASLPPLHDFPDRGVYRLLESRGNVRALLGIVAPDLADRFDYDRLVVLPRTFVDEAHRKREADYVVHLPYRPRDGSREHEVWVYFLLEHQSDPDRWLPFRFLLSIVRLWEAERRDQEERSVPEADRCLSPILPIVLYTGQRRWEGIGSLADLTRVPHELAGLLPRYDSVFFAAAQVPHEALTASGDPLGWLLRLFRLDEAPAEEFRKAIGEAMERMEALAARGERERWLRMAWFVVGYIRHRRPSEEADELLAAARRAVGEPARRREVVTMAKTSADVLREEGMAKGMAKGVAEGKRETLLRLLRRKFGALPQDVEQRIQALTDISRLDELLDRILTAGSIEEMGL